MFAAAVALFDFDAERSRRLLDQVTQRMPGFATGLDDAREAPIALE
jgi:hypothetical protein